MGRKQGREKTDRTMAERHRKGMKETRSRSGKTCVKEKETPAGTQGPTGARGRLHGVARRTSTGDDTNLKTGSILNKKRLVRGNKIGSKKNG